MKRGLAMRGLRAGRRLVAAHLAEALGLCLLLLMAANFLTVISRKSLTNDEIYHIPAGYYHLARADFQLNEEHPPLVKMLSAVPLLFLAIQAPAPVESPAEDPITRGHETFARFWHVNQEKYDAISFWARVPVILLTLSLGALLFVYARELFGARAALFALLLFSLEPTILAHGRVVQTDVPAALGYLLFFFTLQRFLDQPGMRRALAVGAATGLALVVKFSLLIVVPIFILAMLVRMWAARRNGQRLLPWAARFGAATLAALLLINAAYYFRRQPLSAPDAAWASATTAPEFGPVIRALPVFSKVVPTSFIFGILVVAVHNQEGHPAALLGAYGEHGWWYYFPVAFALKTSLAFLLLCLAALPWALDRLFRHRDKKFLLLVIALALYAVLSMTSRINIGIRHFLPAFPLLFIFCGAFLDQSLRLSTRRRRLPLIAIVLLLLSWMGLVTAHAYPDYTSYMNELTWQHPRWYYLSDSNVEWGDDAGALVQYLRARGETRVRAALLGGWVTLGEHGIEYVDAMSPDSDLPQTRYVAIGASFLNGSTVPLKLRGKDGAMLTEEQRHDFFAGYRARAPEAVFGNSIYLYRVKD